MTHLLTAWHAIGWREAVTTASDIAIVYYVIYRALLLIKGTRAQQMLVGLVLVAGGFFAAKRLDLTTVSWLLDNLINYSIIFVIVIFQADIRRALARVGQNLFAGARRYEQTFVFEELIRAAERLAHSRIGALIVLEREADLSEFLTQTGVEIEAKVTKELLVSLFLPDSENQLHDGAVIIRNLRIAQAGAVLPLSANARLDKALGTRHRAAIGISEETDAVVVVVSEERGAISLCFGGNIARDLDGATLRKALLGLFQKEKRTRPSARPITVELKIEPATPPSSVATDPTVEVRPAPAPSPAGPQTEAAAVADEPAGAGAAGSSASALRGVDG